MKNKIRDALKKISHSKAEPIFYALFDAFTAAEYFFLKLKWWLCGGRLPDKKEIEMVCSNVTFIYKSFERQKMAKRLYKCIQRYYPGAKVIIADDSSVPLELDGESLEIIHLEFNSGISAGLNKALAGVETPFVMRMDDDELLTPFSKIGQELEFLLNHDEVDLVGFGVMSTPKCEHPRKSSETYYAQDMRLAPLALKIPHMTRLDSSHIVLGKVANIFLARTDKIKAIGWDDNIRMIDHNEFFMRAAGNIVSVLNPDTIVFHYHNPFDCHYQRYRADVQGDYIYIRNKYRQLLYRANNSEKKN